jgi:Phage capsid family.
MAITKLENLINPEVLADMVDKKLVDAMRFAPLATIDTTLEGAAGSKIKLPHFNFIGLASTLAEGVALTPAQLTASAVEVEIHKIAHGVEITDEAILSAYGNPIDEIASQLALSIASQEDNEVLATLNGITGSMVHTTSGDPTDTDITAALEKFGEDIDGTKVALVSPAVYTAMRGNVHTWIPASELAAGVAIKGVVGEYQGCQVMVSNKLATPKTIYIVKPDALRIFIKRGTQIEADRDILKFTNVFTASKHFATYLYDTSKAIKIVKS